MAAQEVHEPTLLASQEDHRHLARAIQELAMLNDLARTIGASPNLQEVMHAVIHSSLRALGAEQGVITIVDQKTKSPTKTIVRTMSSTSEYKQSHVTQNLIGWMQINKQPLLINDPKRDGRFRGVKWDESIKSLLCVPMMVKSDLQGVLTAYNKKDGSAFNEDDMRLLSIIAGQSAQVVENARLHEQEKDFIRLEEQVRLASEIQQELLPRDAPNIPGYDVAGISVPSRLVGGDYFDFIPAGEGRWAICLGDVSGKGLPASVFMAYLQATLRGQTMPGVCSKLCLRRSNKLLYERSTEEKFVTLFYCILDPANHCLCFSNAGHYPPLLFGADDEPRRLRTGGVVLGILEDHPYEEEIIPLAPGGLLVIYSDGVTEALNAGQDHMGDESLVQLIHQHRGESANQLIHSIIADAKASAGNVLHKDDMTLVVIKRQEEGATRK